MKIVLYSVEWIGHVNPCIALAKLLEKHGHQVIFLVQKKIKDLVTKYSIETVELDEPFEQDENAVKETAMKYVKDKCASFRLSPLERVKMMKPTEWENLIKFVDKYDSQVEEKIKAIDPDLIVYSTLTSIPAINRCGRPWVFLQPMNPLLIYEDQGAPPWIVGFAMDGPKEEWATFRQAWLETDKSMSIDYYDWFAERGVTIPRGKMFSASPYLNLYFYPEDLDYHTEFGAPPSTWFRIEALVRPDSEDPLDLDQEFLNQPGKLIYFSLGTIASFDIELMRKLIGILAKSPNKFVISKGPMADQIVLPSNMRGLKYINQIRLLPMVDLAITHGGNNTFTEALYFGTPMIVMPTAMDQLDNARRLQDKKLGIWLHPYETTETELLEAIDKMLTDQELITRIKNLSKKIQASKSSEEAVKRMENLISKEQKP